MPDILLKNEIGEDIEYDDIDTVTLRTVGGGTALYTYGHPQATDKWKLVQNAAVGDARTNMYSRYTLNVPDGRIFAYTAPDFGTWFQSRNDAWRIHDEVLTQMYSVPHGAILGINSNNKPLYFWDDEEKELIQISSNASQIYNVRKYNGKYVIACYRNWWLYDPDDKSFTVLLSGTAMSMFCFETEDELLMSATNSNSSSPKGIYSLDPDTFELTQIYDSGCYWLGLYRNGKGIEQSSSYVLETEDAYLFSAYSNSNQYGVLKYDKATKQITRIITEGYNYFAESLSQRSAYSTWTREIIGHGVVFSSSNSTAWGVWFYDYTSKTVTRILQTGYIYNWVESEDSLIGSYSSFGCLVYDKNEKTWYHPATSGVYDNCLIMEDGILLGGNSTSLGLKYYEISTGTLTTISSSYGAWRYMIDVSGGALVSCTANNSGIWYFKESDKSLTQLTAQGCEWYMVKWHDAVLMGSFSSNVYGWHYYRNGTLTYNSGLDSSSRAMRCISVVNDGWVIGSWNYSTKMAFIDGETGAVTDLGVTAYQIGEYLSGWYGPNGAWKPSYDYNKKYGRYRILSSYDSSGIIFDDTSHEAIPMYQWNNTDTAPMSSYVKTTAMRRVSFTDIDSNNVLIVCGSSSTSGAVILNHATGRAYLFNSSSMYANNDYNYRFTPLIEFITVDDGFLIYVKPFDYEQCPVMLTSAPGVWRYFSSTGRLQRIYASGYYDTKEDAPGGFYIYLSSLPDECRLYWNSETNTLTKVEY